MRLFTTLTCLLVLTGSLLAEDAKPLPKPLKDGEKAGKGEWFGKRVLPKRHPDEIRIGDWEGKKQVFWSPHDLMNSTVRQDRSGFIRVYDGRREGWVSKDDMVTTEDAPAYFDKAVKANPDDDYAWFMRGLGWLKSGEYENAIKDFAEAIRLRPDEPTNYNSRGNAWKGKKEYVKAIEDYTRAIRLDPKYSIAFNNRGSSWQKMKEYDKAVEDYTTAIRLDPKATYAICNRGNAWLAMKEYDKAITDFTEAIKLDPQDVDSIAATAITLGKFKKYDETAKHFQKALDLDPKDWVQRELASFLATCPEAKYRDGMKAVGLAKKAIEKAGTDADWKYFAALAAAYAEAGDFERAVVEQRKALDDKALDKDDRATMEKRLQLYRDKKPYRDEE